MDPDISDDHGSHTPKRPAAAQLSSAEDKAEGSTENDGIEAAQMKTPSGHKKEV